jgi:predicted HD phosphohydrolase
MADGEHGAGPQAKFTAMIDGTREDWAAIGAHMAPFQRDLANRVLAHLKLLDGDYGGYPVDRLEHSLQTATRAHRDGRDEEYVVCALLHDIGDTLGSANHADVGAAILKPYVSDANHWMLEHHGVFQGYYQSMPLSAFEPMVQRVFSTVKRSIYKKPRAIAAE